MENPEGVSVTGESALRERAEEAAAGQQCRDENTGGTEAKADCEHAEHGNGGKEATEGRSSARAVVRRRAMPRGAGGGSV
jgi:hypothetical protein